MKRTILTLLLIGSFSVQAQPTKAQWDAFLVQYKADSAFKGSQLRVLQQQSSWLDPKYFKVTTTSDKKIDSVRFLPPAAAAANIAPLQKTLDSLIGQYNVFNKWAQNNVDAMTQKIKSVADNLAVTNNNVATLSTAYEDSQAYLLDQIKAIDAEIVKVNAALDAIKKLIPNITITYPQ